MTDTCERKAIDEKAVKDAGDVKRSETNLIESLQLVDRYRIFEDFDLTSLFSYCTERLGLSEDRACTYIQVARKAVEFPALKQALQKNEFSLSHAKKLTKVITAENESVWLERATTLSTRELEKEIAKELPQESVKEKVKPVSGTLYELNCALSPKAVQLLERMMDLLKKQNRGEVIEAALEEFVERHDPIKVAERTEKRKAERTNAGANQAPATRPVYKNGKRTSTPRPLANAALRLAQGQCTWVDANGKRCPNRRYLDKHHKQRVSEGGEHNLPNISVLCTSHHRRHHRLDMPE